MKKIIKIFTLILFILLVFGITTSNAAYTINSRTDAGTMLSQLNSGNKLTGISNTVRKENPYLYCRQHGTTITASAQYTFANSTNESSKVVYPGSDANGYAKAYILAAPGYDKNTERQLAWWKITGQLKASETIPDLYYIAMTYQDFKKDEKDITVDKSSAQTSVSESNIVYGPIKIQYSYKSEKRY